MLRSDAGHLGAATPTVIHHYIHSTYLSTSRASGLQNEPGSQDGEFTNAFHFLLVHFLYFLNVLSLICITFALYVK